jgi:hypothetical protein
MHDERNDAERALGFPAGTIAPRRLDPPDASSLHAPRERMQERELDNLMAKGDANAGGEDVEDASEMSIKNALERMVMKKEERENEEFDKKIESLSGSLDVADVVPSVADESPSSGNEDAAAVVVATTEATAAAPPPQPTISEESVEKKEGDKKEKKHRKKHRSHRSHRKEGDDEKKKTKEGEGDGGEKKHHSKKRRKHRSRRDKKDEEEKKADEPVAEAPPPSPPKTPEKPAVTESVQADSLLGGSDLDADDSDPEEVAKKKEKKNANDKRVLTFAAFADQMGTAKSRAEEKNNEKKKEKYSRSNDTERVRAFEEEVKKLDADRSLTKAQRAAKIHEAVIRNRVVDAEEYAVRAMGDSHKIEEDENDEYDPEAMEIENDPYERALNDQFVVPDHDSEEEDEDASYNEEEEEERRHRRHRRDKRDKKEKKKTNKRRKEVSSDEEEESDVEPEPEPEPEKPPKKSRPKRRKSHREVDMTLDQELADLETTSIARPKGGAHGKLVAKIVDEARNVMRRVPHIKWERNIAELVTDAILSLADPVLRDRDARDWDVSELSRLVSEDVDDLLRRMVHSGSRWAAETAIRMGRTALTINYSEVPEAAAKDDGSRPLCAWSGRPIPPKTACYAFNLKEKGKCHTCYVAFHSFSKEIYAEQFKAYLLYVRFVNYLVFRLRKWNREYDPNTNEIPAADKIASFKRDQNNIWIASYVATFLKLRHVVTKCIVNPEIA